MNWQDHKLLAENLRDQALADLLAARLALRLDTFDIGGTQTTFAHAVVAKAQQTCEKVLKGYLLWHEPSFDPTKGHTPVEGILSRENPPGHVQTFIYSANKVDRVLIENIRWLESFAPGIDAGGAGYEQAIAS